MKTTPFAKPQGRATQASPVRSPHFGRLITLPVIPILNLWRKYWCAMDVAAFLVEYQDFMAPKLDTYEQAIYLHVFRNSRMIGLDEVVIGFKSARTRASIGIGDKGKPISDKLCYDRIRSLQIKGCLEVVTIDRTGFRMKLRLPAEIPGMIIIPEVPTPLALEEMDFFAISENRILILSREGHKCFYCLCQLTSDNYVIEHVVSRPTGNNGFKNVVAACRHCNNRKNDCDVNDFLRTLYREGFLSGDDFEQRLSHLQRLQAGELRPQLP